MRWTRRETGSVRLWLAVAVLGAVVGCSPPSSTATPTEAIIELSPCQLAAPGMPERMAAKCGSLTVYEDRAAQTGRQIELRVAVVEAIGRTPEPDPVFFITGGPGGAATQDYVPLSPAFARIHQHRDIVLVDQRGTGGSHALTCPAPDEEVDEEDEEAAAAYLEACAAQMDADPRLYTTLDAVADLNEVRAALGAEQVNLYGVSYGTRVAQTYLREYPEHVRTVILDGVVPQTEPLGITVSSDAQHALDLMFERCAEDEGCSEAFPDLEGDFRALLERLDEEPVELTIPHPESGEPTDIRFTRDRLAMAVRLFSYNSETLALLPLLIHQAYETGDLSLLAAQATVVAEQLEGSITPGLGYSVDCAEDAPFYYEDGSFVGDAELEADGYLGAFYGEMERICQHWPSAEVSASFKEPVVSDVPVLLLSGEADPVTPPENADEVAAHLSNSLHLVGQGQGHGVLLRGCIPEIMTDFVESGTLEGLETTCVGKLEPFPFFLSFAGTQP
jgi:pimeloyl-ACP methyl ester carboxylesterase